MIESKIEKRVKINQIVQNQIPEFILDESPKFAEFLKQYYISQEYQGGVVDILDNLDQYIKLDNLTPEVINSNITLVGDVSSTDETIFVSSTKGYPSRYGLLKIDDEIITYTGKTENSFTGCIRGFSAITSYTDLEDPGSLVFTTSSSSFHKDETKIVNLSVLFLKEFYNKLKFYLTPGLEDIELVPELNVSSFIKQAKDFYASKGTKESFRILFNVLYGVNPRVVNLDEVLLRPSSSEFIRREIIVAERITGNPYNLIGQTIYSSVDPSLVGSVSEVELITKNSKTYYKISLFIGYDDPRVSIGDFFITAKTKVIENVFPNDEIITVDSTIGFEESGILVHGDNLIRYEKKSINQFLKCSGITDIINTSEDIRENKFLYGYENGDISKRVELIIGGLTSSFEASGDIYLSNEGENIYITNLGEIIPNRDSNNNFKEVFANSWIYNTSSRFQIENINGSTFILKDDIDKSQLKVGDSVNVMFRNSETIAHENSTVVSINKSLKQIVLGNLVGFTQDSSFEYDIRRNLNKVKTSSIELEYGSNKIFSDVQNVYNQNDQYMYVASNSLPSYEITKSLFVAFIPDAKDTRIQGYNPETLKYSIISFPSNVPFISGDEIYYKPENKEIDGLIEGRYYVRVLENKNQIKLYVSKSFIQFDDYIEFSPLYNEEGRHDFILYSQKNLVLGPQKLLRKFPLGIQDKNQNIPETSTNKTIPGSGVGMLVNGVEILSYKSQDRIFYGPLESVRVLNSGSRYDVVNPPLVSVGIPQNGSEAKIQPILKGSLEDIIVDPQDFDIKGVLNATLVGGNGSGAILQPILKTKFRELIFDARMIAQGGSIDPVDETISFIKNHNLRTEEALVYDANKNDPIGIGSYKLSNTNQERYLEDGGVYYPQIVNNSTIKLFNNLEDLNSGINTVGFTTITSGGFHKFRLFEGKTTLDSIKIIKSGSEYQNRKIISDWSGISTINSTIYFKNHGFNDGDLIDYISDGEPISGLSTANQYYVLKVDDDAFQLAKTDRIYFNPTVSIGAGITLSQTIYLPNHNFKNNQRIILAKTFDSDPISVGRTFGINEFSLPFNGDRQVLYVIKKSKDHIGISTIPVGTASTGLFVNYLGSNNSKYYFDVLETSENKSFDFSRRNYVSFASTGSGYQIFSYPQISVNIEYIPIGVGTDKKLINSINITPIIRGNIIDCYLYEKGSKYGSNILNLQSKPSIKIKNGVKCQLKPIIVDGEIVSVEVQNGGSDYYSIPDIEVIGSGYGAKLRPVIKNGKITEVVVISSGKSYDKKTTSIKVSASGSGGIIDCSIRPLTVNNYKKYGTELVFNSEYENNLEYSIVGYSTNIGNSAFGDNLSKHSPIIGWAYDGNPIYGPYGYKEKLNSNSGIGLVNTGYILDTGSVIDRPSDFDPGFFVEDYKFTGDGDLDQYNGRYCVTPEFPNGIYAYFAGIEIDPLINDLNSKFPYFVGDYYRSSVLEQNYDYLTKQSFDFNGENLIRNTLPYNLNKNYSSNDFISGSNLELDQNSTIDYTTKGEVSSIDVVFSGDNYKVNDLLKFDNTNTEGGGASAIVSQINGKDVTSIETNIETYDDVSFYWNGPNSVLGKVNPSNALSNLDTVIISGLSTYVSNLTGTFIVGVSSDTTSLYENIPANTSLTGIVTDILLTRFVPSISVGSTIVINNEELSVLNIFPNNSVVRVKRSYYNDTHSFGDLVFVQSSDFYLQRKGLKFESRIDKIVYFNPQYSVGLGTVSGISSSYQYKIGRKNNQVSIPSQSIYLPDHPFEHNQKIKLTVPSPANPLFVSNTSDGARFNLPLTGSSQDVYVIKKSKDYIGLTTSVGLTTNTDGLFFIDYGSNNYEYSLETLYSPIKGKLQKVTSTVSISTYHNLKLNDVIRLNVLPKETVGIGTSNAVRLKYEQNKLLVNPIGFNSSSVNISENKINIQKHGFITGDKVFYNSSDLIISGLDTGNYFVYRVDDDNIRLSKTKIDLILDNPEFIDFMSSGGANQQLSLINPPLSSIKNNNLVFKLDDSSLEGFKLKIYYDNKFEKEFISVGGTSVSSVVGLGTIGISSTASLTVNYSENIPEVLYYNLEKNGSLIFVDEEVKNYSKIIFSESSYTGTYTIKKLTDTTFDISLLNIPEKNTYNPSTDDVIINYSTFSETSEGGIKNIKLIDGGQNYKKAPKILSIESENGKNAILDVKSKNIGRISRVKINDYGFDYPKDKTLRPQAYIPPFVTVSDSDYIESVSIIDGGSNYQSAPGLIVVNTQTGEKIDSGYLESILSSSSISSVNIIDNPRGLSEVEHKIIAINNSNGVRITSATYSSITGDVVLQLATPINDFNTPPFSEGDKIFVEGVVGVSTIPGTGFNSKDYGYEFFTVSNFVNANPALLTYNLTGITTNPGVPRLVQSSFASVINENKYPKFSIVQKFKSLLPGEKILVFDAVSNTFAEKDLYVFSAEKNNIKVYGNYKVKSGDIIQGKISGSKCTLTEVIENNGKFNIDYKIYRENGWLDNRGELNSDQQVLPDNDYYQNLSYTVKSPVAYEDLASPVNSLLHTIGMKNFADFEIVSESQSLIKSNSSNAYPQFDIISENRVDAINYYDYASDIDLDSGRSKFLKFKNKQLSDYIECKTNRVLKIDDISGRFSNKEDARTGYTDVIELFPNQGYSRFLVQIKNPNPLYNEIQLTEVVILTDEDDIFTLEKTHLTNSSTRLGDFDGVVDSGDNTYLRFVPRDPIKEDYDIKILHTLFNSTFSGITTTKLGSTDLISANYNVGIGTTITIVSGNTNSVKSYHLDVEISNTVKFERNYVEIYFSHDGVNPVISQYYFDTDRTSLSGNFIGTFTASLQSNILKLEYTNTTDDAITIRSNIVGFGVTSSGIGTYRYAAEGQLEDTEKTAKIISNYSLTNSKVAEVLRFNRFDVSSSKSLLRIGYGNTNAMQQVMLVNAGEDLLTKTYPMLSIGSTSGIGTFGAVLDGDSIVLNFYSDQNECEIISLNELFYTELDFVNDYENLRYGSVDQNFSISEYSGISGIRANQSAFDLRSDGFLIFKKVFNPSNSFVFNKPSGQIYLRNHFFSTGEELIYSPKSTFAGIGSISVGISTSLVGGLDFTGDFIVGFSTITGIGNTSGIVIGQNIRGTNIPSGSTVVGIGSTFKYFVGTTDGSKVITGVSNTSILSLNESVFSYRSLVGFGTITSIGINSITVNNNVPVGVGSTYFVNLNSGSITISSVSTASTFRQNYSVGVTTNVLPTKVFAIKQNNDIIKLATRKEDALSGIYVTFTSSGEGNAHELEMDKKLEKSIISIDGVIQSPLNYTPVFHNLTSQISAGTSYISLTGISSIKPLDSIRIDNEYVKVISVGFGQSEFGPITGIGSTALIFVQRSHLGSIATSHNANTKARLYNGSYNINGSTLYLAGIPRGSAGSAEFDESNLRKSKSSFNGRVYLRQDYTTNVIYDDLSYQFTGIGQTYTLKIEDQDTDLVSTGNGILLINQIYQTPTTLNNANNNYEFISSNNSSKVVFSGIESLDDDETIIISESDINQNNLPRGGIIVSLGSTPGLGFAPLVGVPTSMVSVVIGAGGSIRSVGFSSSAPIYGSGYRGIVSIGITDLGGSGSGAIIKAAAGIGGSFSRFIVENGGSGYVTPLLSIPDPSYSDLPVVGVSRLGTGNTTETGSNLLITLDVEASPRTGIGSTLFEVSSFKITRPGYGFKVGDVIKPVGLVTDRRLSAPIEQFELVVTDIFNDSFSAWQFGELDYIDSIKNLQNGTRKRFPLYKNSELLSFQTNRDDEDSSIINLNYLLLILVNGVIQEPGLNYEFFGGSSIVFTEAPKPQDRVVIYFYRGSDQDSREVNVLETIKPGDTVKIDGLEENETNLSSQKPRTVYSIAASDLLETNLYSEYGIEENVYKPLTWIKQKVDKIINEDIIYKSRESLEPNICPTSKIIKSISQSDTEFFVDNIDLFVYEKEFESIDPFDILLLKEINNPISAGATCLVSIAGTVRSVIINEPGNGYSGSNINVKISRPESIGIGIGTTATATASIINGSVSNVSIANPGFGYTYTNPPQIIFEFPSVEKELIKSVSSIRGFSGIVTGITTSAGTNGNPLALKFFLHTSNLEDFDLLKVGYPLYIFDTSIGNGITSIDEDNSSIVGIGTTYVDNIYYVHALSYSASNAVVTTNILSTTLVTGLSTFTNTQNPRGKFSWGRLSGISNRTLPIEVNIDGYRISGLSSFPTIQRKSYGFNNNGSLKPSFE